MEVYLKAKLDIDPTQLMSDGARGCYELERPVDKPTIDVKTKNFDVGHHTVPQQPFFVFVIDGIAIGDIDFGLHLDHPHYTSLQQSGRFCFGMFSDPSTIDKICSYITDLYPIDPAVISGKIANYVQNCMTLFNNNLENATRVADEFMRVERPKATQKYRAQNAKKAAQEQLRCLFRSFSLPGISSQLVFILSLRCTAPLGTRPC